MRAARDQVWPTVRVRSHASVRQPGSANGGEDIQQLFTGASRCGRCKASLEAEARHLPGLVPIDESVRLRRWSHRPRDAFMAGLSRAVLEPRRNAGPRILAVVAVVVLL